MNMFMENEDDRDIEIIDENEENTFDYDSDISSGYDSCSEYYQDFKIQTKSQTRKDSRCAKRYIKAFNYAMKLHKDPEAKVKPTKTPKINKPRYYSDFSYY